jgi:hypothetical protein
METHQKAIAGAFALVLGVAVSAHSQTLVDAAKLAEEQRKSQTGPSLQITTESDFREVRLTDALVRRFAVARSTLSGLYARDQVVYEAVRAGARSVKRFRDFAGVLEQQPKVVESLKIFDFDPAGFVLTEATIRRSIGRAFEEDWGANSRERENTSYARSRGRLARDYDNWHRQDGAHWFWPDSVAYW